MAAPKDSTTEGQNGAITDVEAVPEAAQRTSRPVALPDLPDLQHKLIAMGALEEYLQYRARYFAWRQGGSSGAAGEVGDLANGSRQAPLIHQHEKLVGTPKQYSFFFTVSYWVSICNTAGALMLTFTIVAPLFDTHHKLDPYMMDWLTLLGDIVFTTGAYLNYFELINFHGSGRRSLVILQWSKLEEVHIESKLGCLAFLLGQLIWNVSAMADVMPFELEGAAKVIFNQIPSLIGGIGFAVGGVCEVIHNYEKTPADLVWWASRADCLGCFMFLAGVLFGFLPASVKILSKLAFAVGISCFVASGVIFIMMWRCNDFGLTWLRELNEAMRVGHHVTMARTQSGRPVLRHGTVLQTSARTVQEAPPAGQSEAADGDEEPSSGRRKKDRFSMRTTVFLVMYCWFLACSGMNVVISVFRTEDKISHFLDLINCVLWMFVVILVLVVHSAIGSMPNQQPWKCAILSSRFLLAVATLYQTLALAKWVHLVHTSVPGE